MDEGQGTEILVLPVELTKALQEVSFVRDLERQGGTGHRVERKMYCLQKK